MSHASEAMDVPGTPFRRELERCRHGARLPGALLLLAILLPGAAAAQWTLIELEDLPGGSVSNRVFDVSPDGTTVVGQSHSDLASIAEAYRRTSDGIVGLGRFPGGFSGSRAYAAADAGRAVVGYASSSQGEKAFLWMPLAGLIDIGAGGFGSSGSAISADGQVVYGRMRAPTPGYELFRWTLATGLQSIGRNSSEINVFARDASGDGSRMVGTSDTKGFLWTFGVGYQDLGDLPGGQQRAQAFAISEDGLVVVGSSSGTLGNRATRWTQATGMVDLGPLPGGRDTRPGWSYGAAASGVSGDGSIIVGTVSGSNQTTEEFETLAFIWDAAHGMRELEQVLIDDYGIDTTGFDIDLAQGISADGSVIVGGNLAGDRSWMVLPAVSGSPVPGPSGYGLLATVVLIALFALRATARIHASAKATR